MNTLKEGNPIVVRAREALATITLENWLFYERQAAWDATTGAPKMRTAELRLGGLNQVMACFYEQQIQARFPLVQTKITPMSHTRKDGINTVYVLSIWEAGIRQIVHALDLEELERKRELRVESIGIRLAL